MLKQQDQVLEHHDKMAHTQTGTAGTSRHTQNMMQLTFNIIFGTFKLFLKRIHPTNVKLSSWYI